MRRCVRCGVLERIHVPSGSCPSFVQRAPIWLRALNRLLRVVS